MAEPALPRMKPGVWAGLAYGLLLSAASVLAAGAGHGTYAPLVISAGPLSIHSPGMAVAGVPILWTAFGAAIEWMPRNAGNWLRAALLLYYGGTVWALVHRSESVFVTRAPAALWIVCTLWAVLYLSGQVVVWKHLNRAE